MINMTINVYSYAFNSPVGYIGAAEEDGALTRIFFNMTMEALENGDDGRLSPYRAALGLKRAYAIRESDGLKRAASQLSEYFNGTRAAFELNYAVKGAPFAKSVYEALTRIPIGETRSYKDIAAACGNPKASRAVGMINARNPLPFIIPCHRVVGSDGALTGYAGGLPIKQYLLGLEKTFYSNKTEAY